ncbi:LysM peptidoglycan-binding domain-containing protein [Microbulbifer sediminum]|uniref:LysM peptidoglycan-binding domain-containing protein n=1 Tax=Microbulbifer sediminum TaxID=2904250 RepID=UPI001F465808|nr:LysM peptidoglycan-binding domain-containing protein [Microbulbifer sediminum]
MVHKKLAVAVLAATMGACAQLEEQKAPQQNAPDEWEGTHAQSDNPVDTAPTVEKAMPPVDIWDRLRRGFNLPRHTEHPKVRDYIAYYSRNEGYMARVTERSRRYIFHIAEQLEEANLPMELALLPIVESAYDPFAYSHARASGMWQFIPATGRSFGLHQNWWYDGRRDVAASTRAAIKYFAYLNNKFDGDWALTLAAYNAGEGTVRRARERNARRGKGTSYWDLPLPRETQRYVPQLLALAEVISRPDYYRVPLHDVANEPYYTTVDVGSQIELAQAAELADIEIEELQLLNPGFSRWATDPNGSHQLLIPIDKRDHFLSALQELPEEQRVSWERYRIVRGDNLSTIARRYETSVEAIRQANNLRGNNIRAGKTLLIPRAAGANGQYAYALDQRVGSGKGSSGQRKTSYTVRPGDTLWGIARSLGVTVRQLSSWNNMSTGETLRPGRNLVAYSGSGSSATRKLSYRVRSGDSLYRIARKFSLEIDDILRWNKISKSSYLRPGQRLTLFVDSSASG